MESDYYSFLIYFSHETGRIERYLYNPVSQIELNPAKLLLNMDNSKYTNIRRAIDKNSKDILISKDELDNYLHIKSYEKLTDLFTNKIISFKLLNYGKLNKDFFNMFLIELLRDYLIFFRSFGTSDMKILRNFTHPLYSDEHQLDGLKDLKLGCGEMKNKAIQQEFINRKVEAKDEVLNKVYDLLSVIKNNKFIDYDILMKRYENRIKSEYLINVPKNFNTKYNDELLKNFNYKTVSIEKENLPQCILDLKSFINSSTVINEVDLSNKINIFNKSRSEYLWSR